MKTDPLVHIAKSAVAEQDVNIPEEISTTSRIRQLEAENEQLRADLRDAQRATSSPSGEHRDAIIAELQNERNQLTYNAARLEAERNVLREILFDLQEQLFRLAFRDDDQR